MVSLEIYTQATVLNELRRIYMFVSIIMEQETISLRRSWGTRKEMEGNGIGKIGRRKCNWRSDVISC